MKWVGLTGGVASGKSTVSRLLVEWQVGVVDADVLAHQALIDLKKDLVSHFGSKIMDEKGQILRKTLAEVAFSSVQKKKILENLIHPQVHQLCQKQRAFLEKKGIPWSVYDVPLLFEKNMEHQFDEILFVYAPKHLCIQRIKCRNSLTDQQAEKRFHLQMNIEEKLKKAQKNHQVVKNTGNLRELKICVKAWKESMDQKYLKKLSGSNPK